MKEWFRRVRAGAAARPPGPGGRSGRPGGDDGSGVNGPGGRGVDAGSEGGRPGADGDGGGVPAAPAPRSGWGCIAIRGLRLRGCHGVLPEEAVHPQPFVIDVDLFLDLGMAALTDDLGCTVDYARVARLAAAVVSGPRRRLIESLAAAVADEILAAFPLVRAGAVTVHKPEAPLGIPCGDVSVRLPFAREGAAGAAAEGAGREGIPLAGQ